MIRVVWLSIAFLVATGCAPRADDDVVGFQTALHRIERGHYDEIELRPQWLWLRRDGVAQRSFWPGAQMRPRAKSAVDMHVLRARGQGHVITYITSGEPDPQSPPGD